ncbi:hypothetical protein WS95_01850 [Burkholderia sp. MSMB1826]|nr:hypothetical protein WS95_01850 [Burkholderia sp. MSMB1826]KWE61646.1 hypothetical protein WT53_01880 [Burkholderia sp. MSMB2157WGS]
MKTIPFLFVLRLIVPELKSIPKNEIHLVLESAELTSEDRTKKCYRQCFVASIFVPFIALLSIFFSFGLFSIESRMLTVPVLSAASVYLSLLMLSILGSVIFAPAVREELKSRRNLRQFD